MPTFAEFEAEAARRYTNVEGSVVQEQVDFLQKLLRDNPSIQRVGETGFNGGRSTAAMLSARDDVHILSFDLMHWSYTHEAKLLVDDLFPGRHLLLAGNTLASLPTCTGLLPQLVGTFDMVFVDGGHESPVPQSDIRHMLHFLKPGGWIVVDDVCPQYGTLGVIDAWEEAVREGWVEETGRHSHWDRGWAVGRKTPAATPAPTGDDVPEST